MSHMYVYRNIYMSTYACPCGSVPPASPRARAAKWRPGPSGRPSLGRRFRVSRVGRPAPPAMPAAPRRRLTAAGGTLGDLHRLDPANATWAAIQPSGTAPSSRTFFGFAAAPDGKIYLFGGLSGDGRHPGPLGRCWSPGLAPRVIKDTERIEKLQNRIRLETILLKDHSKVCTLGPGAVAPK